MLVEGFRRHQPQKPQRGAEITGIQMLCHDPQRLTDRSSNAVIDLSGALTAATFQFATKLDGSPTPSPSCVPHRPRPPLHDASHR